MLRKLFLMSILFTSFACMQSVTSVDVHVDSSANSRSTGTGLLTDIGRWLKQSYNTVWGNRHWVIKALLVALAAKVVHSKGKDVNNGKNQFVNGATKIGTESEAMVAGKAVIDGFDFNAKFNGVVRFPFALGRDTLKFGHEMVTEAVDWAYWICSAAKKGCSSGTSVSAGDPASSGTRVPGNGHVQGQGENTYPAPASSLAPR